MAAHCPWCNGTDTQAGIHNLQCLSCGKMFNPDGSKSAGGDDQSTRDAVMSRLMPRQTNIVGNLADLQRAGKAAVESGDAGDPGDAVQLPQGVDQSTVQAEVKAEAAAQKAADAFSDALAASDDAQTGASASASASSSKSSKGAK